jgi:carbon-monoxide dehydrogenase medium subunit
VPPKPARSGAAYTEVSRRRGDFALAGAGAVIGLDDQGTVTHARLSYTSLGPTALRSTHAEESLLGNRLDDAAINRAASLVAEDLSPSDDLHASAAYRLHLACALTARVLHTAAERAA